MTSAQTAGVPMDMAEMVRLAALPPAELLAETRAALLLIDLQNRFVLGSSPDAQPASTKRVIEPASRVLSAARATGIPRFFVTVGYATGASDTAPWMRRVAAMGADVKSRVNQPAPSTWASAIVDQLTPQPGEVHITKYRTSAFFGTALDQLLRGAGIETVVMCGVASYGCIIATYIDAFSHGFFPLLCVEGIDGHDPALHKAAMDYMGPVSSIGVDDIIRVWTAD